MSPGRAIGGSAPFRAFQRVPSFNDVIMTFGKLCQWLSKIACQRSYVLDGGRPFYIQTTRAQTSTFS
eukprot:6704910-Karenia_brevis.AAC.1